jgi:hypothetical protein
MPTLPNVLAIIDGGVVVNVAALSSENDYTQVKAHLASRHDSVLEVPAAGIGWEEYEPGKVRPPSPFPSWVWNGDEWEAPVPKPDGDYYWDESTQSWATAAPISE